MRSKLGRVFSPDSIETDDEPVILGVSDPKEPEMPDFDDDSDFDDADSDKENGSDSEEKSSFKKSDLAAAEELISLNTRELCDKMIAQATSEAARLIEEGHARAQAEYSAAISAAQNDIAAEQQKALTLGRNDAVKACRDEINGCVAKIEDLICRLESDHAAFITGYENDLKWLAIEIAQQILCDTIESDNQKLCSLVLGAVKSVKNARWLKVELSDQMAGVLSTLQQAVESEIPGKAEFKLVSAPADHCVVETPEKVFDASLSQQIENLKIYFANEQGV